MDTFGRLPNDVISQINALYNTPKIEFVVDYLDTTLVIDLLSIKYILPILTPMCKSGEDIYCGNIDGLKRVINDKCGVYTETYNHNKFTINIGNIGIIISTNKNVNIIIPIEHLDVFIDALQKYYDILDSYPKVYTF